ncbi:hypothetical protein ARC78_08000 [Stenotrophomonas pictorum JCM 9942]|uniref:Uncharacterized protein n=1 Tax=Stenotrophomonas pictorum JCM 9942 TaxID=1236960 RepID=A0A0R0ADZ1_9GAMM|nr:hypothetical protein [Stenotrophomonas pictorum]KRG42917.1 hypothetical protein ARC78_08000 [Stenotrophomonas pictorum JCM 9942]
MAWLSLHGGFVLESGPPVLLDILASLVRRFWGLIGIRILKPRRITPERAVYRGVSPCFAGAAAILSVPA